MKYILAIIAGINIALFIVGHYPLNLVAAGIAAGAFVIVKVIQWRMYYD